MKTSLDNIYKDKFNCHPYREVEVKKN